MGKEPKKTAKKTERKPRPTSRNLLRWDDDMDIQLLLSLQKACNRKGMKLPWDEAALHFGPTTTGSGVIQHLAKLRQKRISEGLPVPDALTRGRGRGANRGSSQKTTSEKAKTAQKNVLSNGEDDEEEFDVDKACDSEASFGEERNKRKAKPSVIDADSEVSDNDDEEYGKEAATKTEKVNKNNKGKAKKRTSGGKKAKGIKAESSASPSVAAVERKTRGKTTKHIRDQDDTVTESGADEPNLAAGSSFLKLVGVNDSIEEETNGSDVGIQDTEDNGTSEDVSQDGNRKVTVLKLGKNHSSCGTTPRSSFAGTSRSQSMNLGVDTTTGGNDFQPQYLGQETGYANFGPGADGSFGGVGNHGGFQPFPYSAPMHSLMPPTPMSGVRSGAFPSGSFGSEIGMDNGVAFSATYYPRANMPAFPSPHTPASGREFNGFQEATFGEHGNVSQTGYGASNYNVVGMGGVDLGSVEFGGIGSTGVGGFHHVSSANEYSSADLAGPPTTSGHPFDWTAQNYSVLSSVQIDDMSQFMDSTFNDNMGELGNLDTNGLDNLFSEFKTGSDGSVDADEYV